LLEYIVEADLQFIAALHAPARDVGMAQDALHLFGASGHRDQDNRVAHRTVTMFDSGLQHDESPRRELSRVAIHFQFDVSIDDLHRHNTGCRMGNRLIARTVRHEDSRHSRFSSDVFRSPLLSTQLG
jgi:hypothetical protein